MSHQGTRLNELYTIQRRDVTNQQHHLPECATSAPHWPPSTHSTPAHWQSDGFASRSTLLFSPPPWRTLQPARSPAARSYSAPWQTSPSPWSESRPSDTVPLGSTTPVALAHRAASANANAAPWARTWLGRFVFANTQCGWHPRTWHNKRRARRWAGSADWLADDIARCQSIAERTGRRLGCPLRDRVHRSRRVSSRTRLRIRWHRWHRWYRTLVCCCCRCTPSGMDHGRAISSGIW